MTDTAPAPYRPDSFRAWSPARSARLGYLVGLGWDARRCAEDDLIASTPHAVHRQAQRLGLAFGDAATLRLPGVVMARLDAAARKRRMTREGLTRSLLLAAGAHEGLIDNIIDDGD